MIDEPDDSTDDIQDTADASPYGPQHGRIDDAAGGADSSPFETMSAEERSEALRKARGGQGGAPAP